jgi:DNA polymerase V
LPNASNYTPELIRLAKEGLNRIFRQSFAYKKAGVMLGNLSDDTIEQMNWIAPSQDSVKKKNLMTTIDQINCRYDKTAVKFAAEGLKDRLRNVQARVSPRFTTSWHELLKVT